MLAIAAGAIAAADRQTITQMPNVVIGPNVPLHVIEGLAESHRTRDFPAFERLLRQINSFPSLAAAIEKRPAWPDAANHYALFLLELGHASYASLRIGSIEVGRRLIERACTILRDGKPSTFGRWWAIASVAVLEGAGDMDAAERHVDHLLDWIPDEPSLVLAYAVVADQRASPLAGGDLDGGAVRRIARAYNVARTLPDVEAEATIRLAYLHVRTKQFAEAHALLAAPKPLASIHLAYWSHLIRGRSLDGLGRAEDAAAAYRAALDVAPRAQSPKVALLALQLARGDRAGAPALVDAVVGAADAVDPWWDYWLGDYRVYPHVLRLLRGAV
jgi:tetratricopeptide (TPR) repeat protein